MHSWLTKQYGERFNIVQAEKVSVTCLQSLFLTSQIFICSFFLKTCIESNTYGVQIGYNLFCFFSKWL